jgi:hypothetical protein
MTNKLNKPVNIKLPQDVNDRFKSLAHMQNTSMQDILLAFVYAYIADPLKFKLKMEIHI